MGSRSEPTLATTLAVTVALLLVAITMLAGSASPWAARLSWVLAGVAALVLCGSLGWSGFRRRVGGAPNSGQHVIWGIPYVLLLAWGLVQALNPTHETRHLGAFSLQPRSHVPWLPGSVSSPSTLAALGLLVNCGMVFFLARCMIANSNRTLRTALVVLVLGMGAVAVLCIVQRLEPRPFPVFERTGSFVNENQFAASINLLVAPSLWLAMNFRRRAMADGRLSHPGPLFFALAGILVVSVFLSSSRAGILISVASVLACAALEWKKWRADPDRASSVSARWILAALLIGGSIAIPVAWNTLRSELSTYRNLPSEFQFRGKLYRATFDMFRARWMSGTGAGTFALAFPYYQPEDLPGRFRHAHCEPLQALAELGLPGALLAGLCLVGALKRKANPGGPTSSGSVVSGLRLRSALGIALVGAALHACVDFPFREPSIALMTATLLGLYSATSAAPGRFFGAEREPPA